MEYYILFRDTHSVSHDAKLLKNMEISLLAIGKTNQKYVQAGIDEYLRRLKHYTPFRIECIPDIRNSRNISEEMQKNTEGDKILSSLSPSDYCVVLDEKGTEFTSSGFAAFLQKIMLSGRKRAVFVVGGPYGFSEKVYARANAKISLSKMTFTHEMVRLFFVEQIYRAMTILNGEPYHHE